MKAVAQTLGVSRSNLHDRLSGRTKPRRRYHKAQDAAVLPLITALVAARPTYGYRRITAILNRQLRAQGLRAVNHKRVYRIMQANNLLLARSYTERPARAHDGKVVVVLEPEVVQRRLRVHLLERRRRPGGLYHRRPRPRE